MGCLVTLLAAVVLLLAIKFPVLGIPVAAVIFWKSDYIIEWMNAQEWNTATEFANKFMVYGISGFLFLLPFTQKLSAKSGSAPATAEETNEGPGRQAQHVCAAALNAKVDVGNIGFFYYDGASTLRSDGSYDVKIRMSRKSDTSCPLLMAGKCNVQNGSATITQDYGDDGYVSC